MLHFRKQVLRSVRCWSAGLLLLLLYLLHLLLLLVLPGGPNLCFSRVQST